MDGMMLRTLVEVQSGHPASPSDEAIVPLTAPARAVARTYPGAPQKSDSIELQRTPRADGFASGTITPQAEEDLEMSRPASPVSSREVVEVLPSAWDPYMNRFRLASVCLANLGNALSDAAAGALIPYMEKYVLAIIFPCHWLTPW